MDDCPPSDDANANANADDGGMNHSLLQIPTLLQRTDYYYDSRYHSLHDCYALLLLLLHDYIHSYAHLEMHHDLLHEQEAVSSWK
jgi:hypothetical protein